MTDHDLTRLLDAATDPPGERPPLDRLWTAGRARRRRRRLLSVAAAAVVVALVAGGIASAANDGHGEDVVAGPHADPSGRPPAEPTGSSFALTVVTAAEEDGVAVVEAGGTFTVEVEGEEGFDRSPLVRWEAWDGATWRVEHTLVPGGDGAAPEVHGPDLVATTSATVPVATAVGPLRAPEAAPGWYRACVDLHATFEGPGASVPISGAVCGQLRVVDATDLEDGTTATSEPAVPPPPAEPEAEVVLTTATPTIAPGEDVTVALEGVAPGWMVGLAIIWEAWDGADWRPTHLLTPRYGEDMGVGASAPRPIAERPVPSLDGPAGSEPVDLVTPPVDAGWYRVCIPIGFQEEPAAPPTRELTPCAQVEVVAAADGSAGVVEVDPPPVEAPGPLVVDEPVEPEPGAVLDLTLTLPEGGGWIDAAGTWEQWNGSRWVPTHQVLGFLPTRPDPRLHPIGPGEEPEPASGGFSGDIPRVEVRVPVPPASEVRSPWSRVCIDTGSGDDGGPACLAVEVVDAPDGVSGSLGG